MTHSSSQRSGPVLVLGSFVADVSFRLQRLPAWGETLMGSGFALGPGGKGSNQAVAAAKAGAQVRMLSKLGRDPFAELARQVWREAGVDSSWVAYTDEPTGAAAILVDQARGENAIVVVPGACFSLSPGELEERGAAMKDAAVVLAQLELPLAVVQRGLELGRAAGATTILNPAPAASLPEELLALVDFLIPNETEAAQLTGLPVRSAADAAKAAAALQAGGARHVIVTLGEQGCLLCLAGEAPQAIAPFHVGAVRDTTGAGDAFCGAFAAKLAESATAEAAARFASAAAGLSVTRHGTAQSMPDRGEVEELLADC